MSKSPSHLTLDRNLALLLENILDNRLPSTRQLDTKSYLQQPAQDEEAILILRQSIRTMTHLKCFPLEVSLLDNYTKFLI